MAQSISRIKRTLRQFKKMEIRIRFGDQPESERRPLVWDTFFSTRADAEAPGCYSINRLREMSRDEQKAVYETYFYQIYFQHFRDRGLSVDNLYDPELLALLGLPPHADMHDIKRRYRELAQRHHPDHGGEHEQFIALVDAYERLKG